MIDVSNLKDALKTLGFVAYGDIYEKVFFEIGCSLKVDFKAKRLIYPNEIKGRERNDGFDQKENFVVFECVCRLLSKGYRPEHIELEKEWHLGHDAKGGRADICVSDTSGIAHYVFIFLLNSFSVWICQRLLRVMERKVREQKKSTRKIFGMQNFSPF